MRQALASLSIRNASTPNNVRFPEPLNQYVNIIVPTYLFISFMKLLFQTIQKKIRVSPILNR